jgi:hypothetical protein
MPKYVAHGGEKLGMIREYVEWKLLSTVQTGCDGTIWLLGDTEICTAILMV